MKLNNKLNGRVKLALAIIAILTLLYNTIATHVVARNDIKHLQKTVERLEERVDDLYLLIKGD